MEIHLRYADGYTCPDGPKARPDGSLRRKYLECILSTLSIVCRWLERGRQLIMDTPEIRSGPKLVLWYIITFSQDSSNTL